MKGNKYSVRSHTFKAEGCLFFVAIDDIDPANGRVCGHEQVSDYMSKGEAEEKAAEMIMAEAVSRCY